MVLLEICGLAVSSTKVLCRSVSNAIKQTVALNAPNGNFFQKFCGVVFGMESTTHMLPQEALMILNFEEKAHPTLPEIRERLDAMIKINDLSKGGSPYLNERFLAAAHVLARIPRESV